MMRTRVAHLLQRWLSAILCAGALCGALQAAEPQRAAIASAHPLATAAGYQMLRDGGNAFDAAVAIGAALAVVEPYSTGLGGGGFWLLHRAADGYQIMIDAREIAPAAAALTSYLDRNGKPIAGVMTTGKAVGVPGEVAGLAHLAERYGKLPLAQALAPAIALARDGFKVDARFVRIAQYREQFLVNGVNTAAFLADGKVPQPGYTLRQPQLAATLEAIAQRGRDGFYRGEVAQSLVSAVNAAGGAWQLSDLSGYAVVERPPVKFTYRGATIVSASLPSSGGITLAQALNILEQFPRGDARAPETAHLVIEALRRGFQDRVLYLGDSDFVKVPSARLMDKAYARARAATIDPAAATPSDWLTAGATLAAAESANTTHYSVIDADGNRVGATLSINSWFGSGIVAARSGVLLNNELDDFSLQPEMPNAYSLHSGAANRIAPHKRPLSSMTPTFVEDDKGVLVLGAPGGSRIISMVLLGILDYVDHDQVDLERMVSAPRFHHQCWPDRVEVEPDGFPAEWRAALEAKGHHVQIGSRKWGNMQVVFKARDGAAQAASDPRGLQDFAGY